MELKGLASYFNLDETVQEAVAVAILISLILYYVLHPKPDLTELEVTQVSGPTLIWCRWDRHGPLTSDQ